MSARKIRVLASAFVAAATLAACSNPTGTGGGGGGGGSSAPKNGGTVTIGLAEAPDVLDPTVASTYVGRIVFANMCEKLYDVDAKLNLVPELAAAMPQISNGGKTYTIKLKSGVKFNDGTPLDAKAVVTTLHHYMTDPKSARSAELSEVSDVTASGSDTVTISLKHPFAPLTAILADRSGMILSPKQLSKLGDKFGTDPVCVGPFKFKARPSSDQIQLVKSNDYYDKSKVHLAGVNFTVVTQPNVRAANLRSGDIDIADRVAPTDINTLKSASGVKLAPVTSLGYDSINVNIGNSKGAGKPGNKPVNLPLANAKLRQAFALSLDRDAINKVVNQGQYVPGCTAISPVNPYSPDITCPKQDIAKAKQLVAQSGMKTPIKVKLIVQAANTEATKLGTVIQSMAKKAGFDVKIQPTEFTTALSQAQAGKFEAFNVGWSGRLDPDQNIAPFYDPTSALNYTGSNSPQILKLIAQERATTDMAKRKQIFKELAQATLNEGSIIYLDYPKVVMGYRTSVTGIAYYGDGMIRLKTAAKTSG
ncbi:MAG TPA: ABC transporter substrate-binding protein [Streptosporangiales bacterium]